MGSVNEYGCTEPIFQDVDGKVYVKTNAFGIDLSKRGGVE